MENLVVSTRDGVLSLGCLKDSLESLWRWEQVAFRANFSEFMKNLQICSTNEDDGVSKGLLRSILIIICFEYEIEMRIF